MSHLLTCTWSISSFLQPRLQNNCDHATWRDVMRTDSAHMGLPLNIFLSAGAEWLNRTLLRGIVNVQQVNFLVQLCTLEFFPLTYRHKLFYFPRASYSEFLSHLKLCDDMPSWISWTQLVCVQRWPLTSAFRTWQFVTPLLHLSDCIHLWLSYISFRLSQENDIASFFSVTPSSSVDCSDWNLSPPSSWWAEVSVFSQVNTARNILF